MSKGRLEAFSDGVVAILITIMVLELKIPHGADWAALRPLLPVFLTYVLSFVYLGIYWNNHHHLLHATERINGRVLWANLHLLFWLSLVPFVTGWMGENHDRRTAQRGLRRRAAPRRHRVPDPPARNPRGAGPSFQARGDARRRPERQALALHLCRRHRASRSSTSGYPTPCTSRSPCCGSFRIKESSETFPPRPKPRGSGLRAPGSAAITAGLMFTL